MMILGALSPSKQRKFPVKSSFGYHLHLPLVIHHCNDWRCRNYHDNTDVKPSHQPGQNVGRARHQGLSRQHSTSNLGDSNASFFSEILSAEKIKTIISVLVKLPPFPSPLNLCFIRWRAAVKGLIVSASPAITSDNEYKMENSIWKVLIEFVKERVFSFWCLGFIDFCCFRTLQTQKGGMQTVLSGYDRLVTDSKVREAIPNRSDDKCDSHSSHMTDYIAFHRF